MTDIAKICETGGRTLNQDNVAFCDGVRFSAVVCDGLGAYSGSERASELCAHFICNGLQEMPSLCEEAVGTVFKNAHDAILNEKDNGNISILACTTVASIVSDGKITLACHVGDSRIYLFRNGALAFRTTDHSVAQLAVERGHIDAEKLPFHKDQNKLTRVLGGKYFILPDVKVWNTLEKGDAVLLCTDGFWEYVGKEEMTKAIFSSQTSQEALEKLQGLLIQRAVPSHDNYSAILAVIR